MKHKDEDFCPECGELARDCACGDCSSQDFDDEGDFKFEYAFESITDSKSFFKPNQPLK